MRDSHQFRVLTHHLLRLGMPGGLGLLMVILSAALVVLLIEPDYAEMARQERQLAATASEAERLSRPGEGGGEYSRAEQLAIFYQGFPPEEAIPAWLEKIYALAAEGGVKLDSGEYTLQKAQAGQLSQYRISFPIKGAYPKIRTFISEVLFSAPAIALDSIQLKRENVGEGVAEARIVFLLYLEPAL